LPQTFESDDDIPSDEDCVEEIAFDKFKNLDDDEEDDKKLTPETKAGSSANTMAEAKQREAQEEERRFAEEIAERERLKLQ